MPEHCEVARSGASPAILSARPSRELERQLELLDERIAGEAAETESAAEDGAKVVHRGNRGRGSKQTEMDSAAGASGRPTYWPRF